MNEDFSYTPSGDSTQDKRDRGGRIRGSRFTSLRDGMTCEACLALDDDHLRRLDDPARVVPPHPDCISPEGCRCMEFFQLAEEAMEKGQFGWSEESAELNRRDGGRTWSPEAI